MIRNTKQEKTENMRQVKRMVKEGQLSKAITTKIL